MTVKKKHYARPSMATVHVQGSCLLDNLNSDSTEKLPTNNKEMPPEESLAKGNDDLWTFDEE